MLGFVAWVSGEPFVFPSLGPSAFILAFGRTDRVVGIIVVGVVLAEVHWLAVRYSVAEEHRQC